jgi:dTDP-4-amino-4,6-dideoxygalactose transaminase
MRTDRALRVPFNRPSAGAEERRYIAEVLDSGRLAGNGQMTQECEAVLAEQLGAERVFLTPSCTQALEMAALLLDLEPGAEVICPSFTHPSTANAFALRGAVPVFCDVRPDTLNVDERQLERLISERTAAIVCTHYAGVACEMDELMALCERHGLDLVEDTAHGLFATYRERPLGTMGRFGALSFHETKNVSSGEGGALVLTRAEDTERAEMVREKGTDRAAFFRGEVEAYTWTDLGSGYLPSELQAAFLRGQLERRSEIQAARQRIWDRYVEELRDWASRHRVELPTVPGDRQHPAHLFHLRTPERDQRDRLIEHLSSRGILAVFHYLPLHLSAMGRRLAPDGPALPVTESVAGRVLRLPLFADLEDDEQTEVIEAVTEFSP